MQFFTKFVRSLKTLNIKKKFSFFELFQPNEAVKNGGRATQHYYKLSIVKIDTEKLSVGGV